MSSRGGDFIRAQLGGLFLAGVEEMFEIKVLPGYRCPIVSGPLPDVDQTEPLWLSPPFPTT